MQIWCVACKSSLGFCIFSYGNFMWSVVRVIAGFEQKECSKNYRKETLERVLYWYCIGVTNDINYQHLVRDYTF